MSYFSHGNYQISDNKPIKRGCVSFDAQFERIALMVGKMWWQNHKAAGYSSAQKLGLGYQTLCSLQRLYFLVKI